MEAEILKTAFDELLKEQQSTNDRFEAFSTQLETLSTKVDGLKITNTSKPNVVTKQDLQLLANLLQEQLAAMSKVVESQNKPIIRQWRFLLFPETNAGHYYKIVFGRLIPAGLLFAGFSYLFALGCKFIDDSYRIKEQQFYNEQYRDVLNQLDTALKVEGRRKLHEVIQRVQSVK